VLLGVNMIGERKEVDSLELPRFGILSRVIGLGAQAAGERLAICVLLP
jgi:hypothetical protein